MNYTGHSITKISSGATLSSYDYEAFNLLNNNSCLLQHVSLPLRLRPHPQLQIPGLRRWQQLPLCSGQLCAGLRVLSGPWHGQGDGRHEEGDGQGLRDHGEWLSVTPSNIITGHMYSVVLSYAYSTYQNTSSYAVASWMSSSISSFMST